MAASSVPKIAARWLPMLLLPGGDIERNPGPEDDTDSERASVPPFQRRAVSQPRRAPLPRGPLDLTSGFAAARGHKMAKSLEAFQAWLEAEMQLTLAQALSSQRSAALSVRAYRLHLYDAGHPRNLLVYAITAVQDTCPEYRHHLTPAWQVDKKWQQLFPRAF